MRKITYLMAINETLDFILSLNKKSILIGEDIGIYGGAFGATKNLLYKFGKKRVLETPVSESAIVGTAIGASMIGMRVIVEIQFSDFMTIAIDQIVNQAAKICYISNGKINISIVIRTACGSGTGAASQHSQSLENWFSHIPGLKVIFPSNAFDAKGLLLNSVFDNNPIIFFEHKLLYKKLFFVPKTHYFIPFGKAKIKTFGNDITIISMGYMIINILSIVKFIYINYKITIEVIDLRTLLPLDYETILKSVFKTKRVIIITESVKFCGFGAEIAAIISENEKFLKLKFPIVRLGGEFVPIPAQKKLEYYSIPQKNKIIFLIKKIFNIN